METFFPFNSFLVHNVTNIVLKIETHTSETNTVIHSRVYENNRKMNDIAR